MSGTRWRRTLAIAAVVGLLSLGALWFGYRPWALNWGATPEEIASVMPGDAIVPEPDFNATRAVTVVAPPAAIWPWLIQMGYGRAGFYSYDWIDNDGIPSADHLILEYQHLALGDSLPLTGHDYVKVTLMKPDSAMLWEYAGDDTATVFTWAWRIHPLDRQRSRLVSRLRYDASSIKSRVMLDFFEIVMMRKCLLGIRDRAEEAFDRR